MSLFDYESTQAGAQAVIPGCERRDPPSAKQLTLFAARPEPKAAAPAKEGRPDANA